MSTLIGDASLSGRPMMRVVKPLRARGAVIEGTPHPSRPNDLTAPLTIGPLPRGTRLSAIEYESPVSSAQVKSALLLSGLTADGPTHFKEPTVSRDHTERMLRASGAPLQTLASYIELDPTGWDGRLGPLDLDIPGDLSAAAFLLVAAQITPGSRVTVRGVGLNPTRMGLLEIARDMRAGLVVLPGEPRGGEPVGVLEAFYAPLVATRAGGERVARAIDEICIACALAARASGTTRIEGAAELRVKESDRIDMMAKTLHAFGVGCEQLPDGLPGLVKTYGLRVDGAVKTMDLGLLYRALAQNDVDMVAGNSTDGALSVLPVEVLKDDKRYFPPYEVAIIVREQALAEFPGLETALAKLSGKITTGMMRKWNYEVDGKHRPVREVAATALGEIERRGP